MRGSTYLLKLVPLAVVSFLRGHAEISLWARGNISVVMELGLRGCECGWFLCCL